MDPITEIKDRLSIEDVVGRYVDLKRSGASFKGLCPFHQEKTPSFYVTPSRGSYHCFGCGRGGDVFSFVMEADHLDFREALGRLADQAGVTLAEREARKPSLAGRLFEANETAAHFFHQALAGREGQRAREYLSGRRFGAEAAEMFDLGYAPDSRDALVRNLHDAGFDDRTILAAGLALQDDIGGKMRDRFRGRLMFPIRNASGRILGFGGRILGDGQPKYLNSPQTEIFDKSSVLFGIHRSSDPIRQGRQAVLVEGYLDAVRAHLAGYERVVASLGTAVTAAQLSALSRLADTVTIALDPDPAGMAAAARTSLTALAEVTESRGRSSGAAGAVDLRIARLPHTHGDPDELIRDHPQLWEEALANSVPVFDFYFAHTLEAIDRSSDSWRQDAIDRLLPVISRFATSAGWQALWLERLAAETGIDPGALQRAVPGARGRPRQRGRKPGQKVQDVVGGTTSRALTADPVSGVQSALLALLVHLMVIPRDAGQLLSGLMLERRDDMEILEHLLSWQETGNYDYEMFREHLPQELRERANELRGRDVPLPDDDKISVSVAQHLARIRQFRLQSQLARARGLLEEMDVVDRGEATQHVATLAREKFEVEQDLERLSRQALRLRSEQTVQGTMDQDSGSW